MVKSKNLQDGVGDNCILQYTRVTKRWYSNRYSWGQGCVGVIERRSPILDVGGGPRGNDGLCG